MATAIGQGAVASQVGATAIGQGAKATADPTTAVGNNAQALSNNASAFGAGAIAGVASGNGDNATAIGQSAVAIGVNATALGQGAVASGANSTALGQGASTGGFAGSTAIGAGAANTAANQVMIGTAKTTYSLPGLSSAASLAAQTGPTSFVTTDANGNLATANFNPASVTSSINALSSAVASLQSDIKRSYAGTAIAIALGGGALPSDKKFALSGNFGTYLGQQAFGVTALVRISDNVVFNAGVGGGFQQGGVGARAGLTLAW